MEDTLDYARRRAPEDVRETLDWLLAEGFAVARTAGGPDAGFGDVLVELARGDRSVVIVRDRSQWMCDVATGGGPPRRLDDLLRESGIDVEAPPAGALPEQLPAGVAWREVLPRFLDLPG